jgi:RimJ/RimL family protein N-acetyltransferase
VKFRASDGATDSVSPDSPACGAAIAILPPDSCRRKRAIVSLGLHSRVGYLGRPFGVGGCAASDAMKKVEMEICVAQNQTPLGAAVDPTPAKRPQRAILSGRVVDLVPLNADAHADALFEGANGGDNDRVWTYLFDGPFADRAAFRANIEAKAKSEDPLFFAIVDKASNRAVGYQTFLRIEPQHRVIEVGAIMYTPAMQRSIGATEAQYLFARTVFDELGYRRYEWKCNDLNAPSKRAALRFGFTFEGVFRQHMIVKGRNRDTAWFSMLDSEWPKRRAAFEQWLAPSNFDAAGRQRLALSGLNEGRA